MNITKVSICREAYKEVCYLCLQKTQVKTIYLPMSAAPTHPKAPLRICKPCLSSLAQWMTKKAEEM